MKVKPLLKSSAVFAGGLILGAVVAGYVSSYLYQQQFGHWAVFQSSLDVGLLEMYRSANGNENIERYFDSVEKSIPETVMMMDEQKDSGPKADDYLYAAKKFYVCTGRPIPEDIRHILERIEMSREKDCGAPPK